MDSASTPQPSSPQLQSRPLRLRFVADELHLSVRSLAHAAGISSTALQTIIVSDYWPKRVAREKIKSRIANVVREAGGTDDQIAGLFVRSEPAVRRGWSVKGWAVAHPTTNTNEEPKVLLPKQTLRPEARKAFKLFNNPFDGEVCSDEEMFNSPDIAYVREACMQAAMGSRFMAVVGESGGGKTTIVSDLEARIARERKPVQFIRPSTVGMENSDSTGRKLKTQDILASIITAFDPNAGVPPTIQARSTAAKKALTQSVEGGNFNLLVIEEAHCLPDDTLRHLKRLHEMRLRMRPMLGILLVGQTELAQRLDARYASLREVTQRCEVVRLMPLDHDLRAYLEHRAKCAGRALSDFIDGEGVDEIRARLTITRAGSAGKSHAISLCYPLATNNLMTAALNVAAEIGAPLVTKDVVRAV